MHDEFLIFKGHMKQSNIDFVRKQLWFFSKKWMSEIF